MHETTSCPCHTGKLREEEKIFIKFNGSFHAHGSLSYFNERKYKQIYYSVYLLPK